MNHFDEFNLPEALNTSLAKMNFTTPTPIQQKAIPFGLEGKDILGTAGTGTGKTGAFGIPLIAHLLNNQGSKALVITPTRELATQVLAALKQMFHPKEFRTALLIGGDPIFKQLKQLKAKPRLIVGTPGRINDHLKRNNSFLNGTDYLVLDEMDRMLDMGFSIQIEETLNYIQEDRQTLLFSATLPHYIEKMAHKYLKEPERVHVKTEQQDMSNITHEKIEIKHAKKTERLLEELDQRQGSVIIFVKTKGETEKMAYMLSKNGHSADAINGDLRQNKRDRIIKNFRDEKFRILVGTDIIARGLDIPHVRHVISYDLPQCPEDYIHRIGRTARAGATGDALCFVTPSEKRTWQIIDRLMNPQKQGEERHHDRPDEGGARKKRPYRSNGGGSRNSSFSKDKPAFRGKRKTGDSSSASTHSGSSARRAPAKRKFSSSANG